MISPFCTATRRTGRDVGVGDEMRSHGQRCPCPLHPPFMHRLGLGFKIYMSLKQIKGKLFYSICLLWGHLLRELGVDLSEVDSGYLPLSHFHQVMTQKKINKKADVPSI